MTILEATTPVPVTLPHMQPSDSFIQHGSPIGPRNDIAIRVQAHIERFVAFNNPHHSRVLALWALHTWVFDAFRVTPYIYVSSIDPGAGKTTLMEVMEGLVRSPNLTASTSPAALYRSLVEDTPTLILDELDAVYSGAKNEDLRGVLNSGYKSSGNVTRFIQGESTNFPTYCPKFLGGIDNGQVPPTVLDRSIRIRLRKLDGDTLAKLGIVDYDFEELEEDLDAIQELVREWGTADNAQAVKGMNVERIPGLSAREWQLIRPLLKIAAFLGFESEARDSLSVIFKGEAVETNETKVLRTADKLFQDTGSDRLTTAMLAEATGYTPSVLSRMLSPLGIVSRPMKVNGATVRGYYRPEFQQAWDRFL